MRKRRGKRLVVGPKIIGACAIAPDAVFKPWAARPADGKEAMEGKGTAGACMGGSTRPPGASRCRQSALAAAPMSLATLAFTNCCPKTKQHTASTS